MVLVDVSASAEGIGCTVGGTGEYCVAGSAVGGGGVWNEYCGTVKACWLG